jgi:scyllo-inositol 2-dehydrogenase (NADP+)
VERKIITGLASYGMSGKVFHAPLLMTNPAFHLKSIVERSKNEVQSVYPSIITLRSFDELLVDPEIELIVINTPDHTHAAYAHKALMAGKHLVVEKPFTFHASEGEDLLNLAHKKKLVLTVFQNRRWDGDFLTIRQLILKQKLLGRLVEYEARYDRYRNFINSDTWKEDPSTGTGTLYNLGSHLIDQALVLFGLPEAVTSDIGILRTDGKVDDYFEVLLHYKQIKVSLKASYLVREPGPRYSLHGTLGSYLKYGTDPQEEALKQGHTPVEAGWGEEPEGCWGILNSEIKGEHYHGKFKTIPGNYQEFYNNLYEAVRHGKELAVKPEEAINVIRVIEAAIKSNKNKRTELL